MFASVSFSMYNVWWPYNFILRVPHLGEKWSEIRREPIQINKYIKKTTEKSLNEMVGERAAGFIVLCKPSTYRLCLCIGAMKEIWNYFTVGLIKYKCLAMTTNPGADIWIHFINLSNLYYLYWTKTERSFCRRLGHCFRFGPVSLLCVELLIISICADSMAVSVRMSFVFTIAVMNEMLNAKE